MRKGGTCLSKKGVGSRTLARIQELIGIEDVLEVPVPGYKEPWGVVVLPGGDRYRVILHANSMVNLGLLTAAEQDAAEDGWMAVLRMVDFPLQIFVQSRPVTMPEMILSGSDRLQDYAAAYARHLAAWQNHTVQTRRVFLAVPSDGKPMDEAIREFDRRVRILAAGLARWVQLKILDPVELQDVLAAFWRKGRATPAAAATEWKWGRPVVEGVRLADVRDAFAQVVQEKTGSNTR